MNHDYVKTRSYYSGLQIDEAELPASRTIRRGSAFLDITNVDSYEDFSNVSSMADVRSAGQDVATRDDAVFPLYYLDHNGQARDFIDPAVMKPAYRKFAIGVKTAGLLFLDTSTQKQMLCKSDDDALSDSSLLSDCSCAD